jgi:hypothetical protein
MKIPLLNARGSYSLLSDYSFKKELPFMQASRSLKSITGSLKIRRHAALFLFILISIIATAQAHAQTTTPTTTTTTTTTNQPEATEQQEEKPQPTPALPAKSVVRGRVIYDDTNRPVRRARIMLLKSDGGGAEKTGATDERGEFSVKDVAAGSYFLIVDAPGIVTPFSSVDLDEGMDEKTAFIAIKKDYDEITVNGTNTVNVQVRAKRGGVITGRVNYQDGDQATGAQIVILRKKDNRLVRFLTGISAFSMLGFRTDDRGVYRIAGLPPGEYVVGASEANTREDAREFDASGMGSILGNSNLSVSYYQNETSLRQATTVKVELGQEAGDINITLIDRAAYTISGTVVARQGRKPVRARLSLQSKTEASTLTFFDSGPTAESDEQGRFSFTNIPDGAYVIKADPASGTTEEDVQDVMKNDAPIRYGNPSTEPPEPKRPSLVARQQEVTVSGGDLSGIVIEVSEGGRLQGTISVEGNDRQLLQGFNVSLAPRDGGDTLGQYSFIQTGGSFTIDRIPSGEFYVSVQQLSDKFYVKSITSGSTDLMREPVRVVAGASVDNIRIIVSSEVATLQGRVNSSVDAKPVRGAVVLLVLSDPTRWRFPGSFLPAVTEADGTFKITSAPGSYLLVLLREGENLRSVDEAFVRARSAGARAVTLQPNGRETVELVAPASSP